MIRAIDFQAKDGRYRLEAVGPGVIRCVHTREAEIAAPSGMVAAEAGEPAGVDESDGRCIRLRAGGLLAEFDRTGRRIT